MWNGSNERREKERGSFTSQLFYERELLPRETGVVENEKEFYEKSK